MGNPPDPVQPPAPAPPQPADPAPPQPPAPAPAQPPAPAPAPSDSLLDTLMNSVQALTDQVAKLQPRDSNPVPRPWTHWGSKR